MRLALFGASGLFGINYQKFNSLKYNLKSISRNPYESYVNTILDARNFKSVEYFLKSFKPDIIIHSIAVASHSKCENDSIVCREINFTTVKNIVDSAQNIESKLIFLSSDSVFNGVTGYYSEIDKTQPFSLYGELKIEAENYIIENFQNYLILRGSFFGNDVKNNSGIFNFFMSNLQKENKVLGLTDVFSNSLDLKSLSEIINLAIEKDLRGIYHFGTECGYTKYDFGLIIAKMLNADLDLIEQGKAMDLSDNFFAPRNLILDTRKLLSALRYSPISIKDSLGKILMTK